MLIGNSRSALCPGSPLHGRLPLPPLGRFVSRRFLLWPATARWPERETLVRMSMHERRVSALWSRRGREFDPLWQLHSPCCSSTALRSQGNLKAMPRSASITSRRRLRRTASCGSGLALTLHREKRKLAWVHHTAGMYCRRLDRISNVLGTTRCELNSGESAHILAGPQSRVDWQWHRRRLLRRQRLRAGTTSHRDAGSHGGMS
jgi:hypothetical protein